MFYLETRNSDKELNEIQIVKLKNKLGTRQLPTAELLLAGTKAHLVGELGKGVATISHMLTISRMYNSLFSSSATRRFIILMVWLISFCFFLYNYYSLLYNLYM